MQAFSVTNPSLLVENRRIPEETYRRHQINYFYILFLMSLFFNLLQIVAMWGCIGRHAVNVAAFTTTTGTRALTRRAATAAGSVAAKRISENNSQVLLSSFSSPMALRMSSSTTEAAATIPAILPRVKAADASEPSDGPVLVKGWVRTVRKQKTLAFVEVNDGSNLGGIQCVLSFDAIDDATQEGVYPV